MTSQQAGNQVWANTASTAPGGASGDLGNDVGDAVVVTAPVIEMQPEIDPGTSGKPQARGTSYAPKQAPGWDKTTVPEVVREK